MIIMTAENKEIMESHKEVILEYRKLGKNYCKLIKELKDAKAAYKELEVKY